MIGIPDKVGTRALGRSALCIGRKMRILDRTGLEWVIIKIPDKVRTRALGWFALCIGRQMRVPDISAVIFPDINIV